MRCPRCKKTIPDSSPYCAYCGARIQPTLLPPLDWSQIGVIVAVTVLVVSGVVFLGAAGLWAVGIIGLPSPQVAQQAEVVVTPPQLTGQSVAELHASVEKAQGTVEAVKKTLETQAAATRVPAGAPARAGVPLEGMSPREKIAYAIKQKGGM